MAELSTYHKHCLYDAITAAKEMNRDDVVQILLPVAEGHSAPTEETTETLSRLAFVLAYGDTTSFEACRTLINAWS